MTAIARKIAALEALAASTTFPAEAETSRRLAAKLRERADVDATAEDPAAREAAEQDALFAETWAARVLNAFSATDFGFADDQWIVPDHGPLLDRRGLIALALERGLMPHDQHLQASIIVAMRWNV